jgi:hypothetical protein
MNLAAYENGTLWMSGKEFKRYVAVAQLAIELARLREGEGSAEQFLDEAIELICGAHDRIDERK